jgi:hypothetical protein
VISQRLLSDFAAISKRLQSDFKVISWRLRSDYAALRSDNEKHFHGD